MKPYPWWQGPRGEGYVVIQGVLMILVVFGPRALPGLPLWGMPWSAIGRAAGLLMALAGGGLAAAGMLRLGENLTAVPRPKEDARLVETGAYGLVRHPIYSGLVLAALGWALIVSSWLTVGYALILFAFFDIKSRREERWLSEKFSGYADYQRRVRKLIPLVY